jgi:hypothetical protein
MNNESFKVRAYGFGELAQLYFPNIAKKSASTQLGKWIRLNDSLKDQLTQSGFFPGNRILTPKQVEIIVKIIGEP